MGALVDEQALELANVLVAPVPGLLRGDLANAHRDYILVVRAVEDPQLAPLRQRCVNAPEVIVRELGRRRDFERGDPAALWVNAGEDVLDRPVLAGGVDALEDEQ